MVQQQRFLQSPTRAAVAACLHKEPQDSSPDFVPPVQPKIYLVASELAVASQMFAAGEEG